MTQQRNDIRNFAIIAHIDHGKTTLVDAMLGQAGIFRTNEAVPDRVMDSNDQERERGITILAKNTAINYQGIKLNILDTPGHADFGGEVERVLSMADAVVLLVDAAEGPLPQTRFVLRKAFEKHLKPIVVINKIDRKDARPKEVLDEVYDLFIDLGADEDMLGFPVLYAIAREGIAKLALEDEGKNLGPLFETIVKHVPPPRDRTDEPLQILISNTEYDDYVGQVAIGRAVAGKVNQNQPVFVLGADGKATAARVMRLYTFDGLKRKEIASSNSGDIVAVAGVEGVEIGDTIVGDVTTPPVPRIVVDPPTLRMTFMVNNSPFAGKEGKYVTSRQIRERLTKAGKQNVALKISDGSTPDQFEVAGRGELQLAVLVETMRREGYELQLSRPDVVTRVAPSGNGLEEPMEHVTIDVPEEHIGIVTNKMSDRRGHMVTMHNPGSGRVRLEYRIPSRGLIGFRSEFLTDTRGTGVLNTLFDGWAPHLGPIPKRPNGGLVSDRMGRTTPYAIYNLQPRGIMFIGANTDVYEGMLVGVNNRDNDLDVNICREKKLTNIRAAGKDENIILSPPKVMSLEQSIEFIDEDELVEVTPKSIRLRKKILSGGQRPKRVVKEDDDE